MQNEPLFSPPRRRFLKEASAGVLILKPETVFGSQANSAVEVGLVGCGGRGNWITPFFVEYTGARVVAVADVVQSHLDKTRDKFKVDPGRAYYGPEASRQLAESKLDAVIIETPPYFHPDHAAEAVAAGKHVYVAKPVAVDVPGCRSILASGRKAQEKKLNFLVDFQSRSQPVFQEAAQRVHRGDIGKPAMAQVFYYAGRPSKDRYQPGMEPGQQRLAKAGAPTGRERPMMPAMPGIISWSPSGIPTTSTRRSAPTS
ncbi:MAG: Gfo/Idh/MocA family oxidoreductase [Acidobacteria bacterium]|nr:Gfo/Idh/MocA family oxidoreductase [Acidobacteriota bacterium]